MWAVWICLGLLGTSNAFLTSFKSARILSTHLNSGAVSTNPEPEDLAIFCNREMHGESLEAIGFDMDFTLAQYNEEFDLLAFEGAREKLHSTLGYPPEVLDFQYSPTLFRRGLVIDKQSGNIIKVDRHRYARKVVHGLTEMSSEELAVCRL